MKPIIITLLIAGAIGIGVGCTVNSTTSNNGTTCNQDTGIACAGGTSGYSCSGSDSPDQDNSNLNCGAGVADGVNTDYCCVALTSGVTCQQDSSVQGCPGNSYGFSCTGSDTPDMDDSSLSCSTGTPGNGNTQYCCSTGAFDDGGTDSGPDTGPDSAPDGGNTCATDTSVTCTGNAVGYQCTSSDSPDQEDSTLNCSTGTPDGSNTDYCCIPLTSGVTCAADSSVSGCQAGSYGFSCTGTDTPDQDDSSLTCSTGTPGTGGETLYCCTD
jgi:hypothetical protein